MFEQTAEWWNTEVNGVRHADMTPTEFVETYGGSSDAWRSRRKRAKIKFKDEVAFRAMGNGAPIEIGEPAPPKSIDEVVARDRELERLKNDNATINAKYRAVLNRANRYEDLAWTAREQIRAIPEVVIQPPHIGRGANREDAILGWADWHGGEVIDYDIMQGMNSYNPVIMCRRAQRTVDKTLSLLFDCHAGTTFETLYVFDLGDGVNGDLLNSHKATNAMGVFESMLLVARVKATALIEMSAHIPVVFVAVPGNHGRRADKMDWKQPTETADWLVAEMIAALCKDNPRVTCVIPKAWTCAVEIRGHTHSLNHGYSASKGGNGGIPFYAQMRRDGLEMAMESVQGHKVSFRWRGHIHTPATIPMTDGIGDQYSVGSLCGGGEYAKEELGRYGDPFQKLVGAHELTGVSWEYKLSVKHGDDKPSRYEEMIPG